MDQAQNSPYQPQIPSLERFYPTPDAEMGITESKISDDDIKRHYRRYTTISQLMRRHVKDTDIILDVGSGSGYGTNILFSEYHYVFGVEPNETARKYADKHYPHIRFLEDMEGADAVVMVESIEHMTKSEARVYFAGARVVAMTTPLVSGNFNDYHINIFKHPDDVELFMTREGFKLLEERLEKDIVFTTGDKGDQYYGVFERIFK